MRNRTSLIQIFSLIFILSVMISGCGPSAEEQAATSAAQTAMAATDTPMPTPTDTPTPTATPVPYDLSVIVTGEEDAPIVGANVLLDEVEDETGTQITDEVGQTFWSDLPGETVSLSISAQGYFPLDLTDSLERGINQIVVALERDPHGLLPSEACAPGERLLYIEDFQDGEAQDWLEIEHRAQGWDVAPHPDSLGNIVALNMSRNAYTNLRDHEFDNAVWRFKYMISGQATWVSPGWSFMDEPYDIKRGTVEVSWYAIWINPIEPHIGVGRCEHPIGCLDLAIHHPRITKDEWHEVEIGTYQNQLEVWVDGSRFVKYDDPIPLPNGTLMLEASVAQPDDMSAIYFDDFSVCELTAPLGNEPSAEL